LKKEKLKQALKEKEKATKELEQGKVRQKYEVDGLQ